MARRTMLNVMPWREVECRRAKRRFIYQAAASALGGLIMLGVVMLWLTTQTTALRQQASQLEHTWRKLQPQLTYVSRLRQVIERIKQSQKIIAQHQDLSCQHHRMLLWFAEHWPVTARLTKLRLARDEYRLHGNIVEEDNALAALMTRLNQLSHIKQVDLIDWQMTDWHQGQFALRIRMANDESDITD